MLAATDRMSPTCVAALEHNFEFTNTGSFAFRFGGLQMTMKEGSAFFGVAEPRRDGGATSPTRR